MGCPWQNGHIERLFGTLKRKLDQRQVADGEQLQTALTVSGTTPCGRTKTWADERRWRPGTGIDPYRVPRRVKWFEAWGGLLSGFYLSG